MTVSLRGEVEVQLTQVAGFPDLASRCLGAWPPLILEELLVLSRSGSPLAARAASIALEAGRTRGQTGRRGYSPLPVEHPLDGDWRFARRVPGSLVDRLISTAGENGRMLLLCVPTVVIEVARRGLSHRAVVGIRERDPVTDALRRSVPGATYLPTRELTGVGAAIGLVDPPWCAEVACPIVASLASGVRRGGVVLVTGPDHLTASTTAGLMSAGDPSPVWPGLDAVGTSSRVRYETPRFEARALQASGVRNVPPNWRTGLLHAYLRNHDDVVAVEGPLNTDWEEFKVEGHRIWVREKAANGDGWQVQGCPSVSRTAPLRARASVWTSGNVVATGGTPADLRSLRDDMLGGSQGALLTALLAAERGAAVDIVARGPSGCLLERTTV